MVTFLSNHLTVYNDKNSFQEGLTRFITRSIFYMMMIKLTISVIIKLQHIWKSVPRLPHAIFISTSINSISG